MGVNERETTLMTRTSKYVNQDTIVLYKLFKLKRLIVK